MIKCLVTGGAGFIGSHLVDALLASGQDVTVLDNFSTGKQENIAHVRGKIHVIDDSILERAAVRRAVAGVDCVYHLAALPSVQRSVEDPEQTHEVCATGTLRVLSGALRAGVRRVVYAASSSAYGEAPGSFRSESQGVAPISPYAVAKLAGEHYLRSFSLVYGLETVRLRFFNIFGPRQDSHSPYSGVIPKFISQMASGQRPVIHGDGLQSRDFTYVENAVQALLKAAVAPRAVGNVYNIGSGGKVTLLELVQALNEILGTDLAPDHTSPRPGDVRESQADIASARRDLGYLPTVPFALGLRLTIPAVRKVGELRPLTVPPPQTVLSA